MKTLESTDQKAVVSYLRKNKIFFFAPIGENPYSKYVPKKRLFAIQAELKMMGSLRGVPDLVIMLPNCLLYLELKRIKDGRVSKEQTEFLNKAKELDYARVAVGYGYEHAIEIIEGLK